MKLTFKPVTTRTVGDFEALFYAPGGPKYCWCMAYRATADELKAGRGPARRKQILGRVADGIPIGIVGYSNGEPVAWVSVAPKVTFRGLGGPSPGDGAEVWSISCMFLRRDLRRDGLGHALIAAAIAHARRHKATRLEAYPVDADSPSYRHMGFVPAFERAGFTEEGRIGTRRHLMQLTL